MKASQEIVPVFVLDVYENMEVNESYDIFKRSLGKNYKKR